MADTEKKILIIDPDERDRTVIASFLQNENFSVEIASGIYDAIKKLSNSRFHCLIMDVNLPEMLGYKAVSLLKNIDPKLKIIMTTKKNTIYLESKVREQDIFFYFIKSFGKDELKLAINDAIKQ